RKARRLLPHRIDLLSLHLQLLLGDRQLAAARKVLTRDLEPISGREPERYEQAREAVERTQLLLDSEAAFEAGNPDQGLRLLDLAIHLTTDTRLRERLEGELLRLQAVHAEP
ncbi:MAG: hypothetical protein MI919_08105, partial [Holophagales bacterium]|nr:hypothetical protein [Holophagales bacterium]